MQALTDQKKKLEVFSESADMPHMEILASALQGLNSAESKLDQAAVRISQAGAAAGTSGDPVDLATEIVNLAVAKEEYQANLKALQAGNDLAQHTIDILA